MRKFNLQLFAEEETTQEATVEANEEATGAEATEEGSKEEDKSEKKYTDEDINKILDRKFAEMTKRIEKEAAKKAEASKLAKMSEVEKQQEKMKQLEAELNALKEKDAISEMSKTARAILDEKNLHIPDGLLSVLVTSDAEQTKANVDEFTELFNKAVADAVKERVKGKTPEASVAPATMTKDEILAIKDQTERQKKINENISLFVK